MAVAQPNGARVSPHVSAREMLQAVIAGKMTPEEAKAKVSARASSALRAGAD